MLGLIFLSGPAWGQWTSQTVGLQAGWNAVWLEVQPEPPECDAIFNSIQVEMILGWNRRFSSVQFIQDPTSLTPKTPDWLVYLPPLHRLAGEMNLFTLEGGKCYLIKLPDDSPPINWVVRGRPILRKIDWQPDSLNLVGFSLDLATPPTFQRFFSDSSAHNTNAVFRLSQSGHWTNVANLSTTRMRSGEAFWIRCTGVSDYQGPLNLTLPRRSGLDFGRSLVEQTVVIKNASTNTRTVTLNRQASENPSVTTYAAVAGHVPLYYWRFDATRNAANWEPLPVSLTTNLSPGQEWTLRLEARRSEMVPAAVPAGFSGASYQTILQVKDSTNSSRIPIGVVSDGIPFLTRASPQVGNRLTLAAATGSNPSPRAGLWIGAVTIDKVSQPASPNPSKPLPTVNQFNFRLILHVDDLGQVRLLQKVYLLWEKGSYKPDPAHPGAQIVDQPGRVVLVTNDRDVAVPGTTGSALRDGQPVARRFSSAAFGLREPKLMASTGLFGVDGTRCTAELFLSYDDPLNPFKHLYHPDHDNWNDIRSTKLPEGVESYSISRQIQLSFATADPEKFSMAGWGDSQLGGTYMETFTGLHKDPVHIKGTFRLHLTSRETTIK